MEEFINDIKIFIEAQQQAEETGNEEFFCPICGGRAVWHRSPHNNHLHCGCKDCGIRMME